MKRSSLLGSKMTAKHSSPPHSHLPRTRPVIVPRFLGRRNNGIPSPEEKRETDKAGQEPWEHYYKAAMLLGRDVVTAASSASHAACCAVGSRPPSSSCLTLPHVSLFSLARRQYSYSEFDRMLLIFFSISVRGCGMIKKKKCSSVLVVPAC